MRSSRFRNILIALIAIGGASVSSVAYADSGSIHISVLKGGWFIGGSAGSGTLTFHGRQYPLSVGGIDAGFVFGGSQTDFAGRASHLRRPSPTRGGRIRSRQRRRHRRAWRAADHCADQ